MHYKQQVIIRKVERRQKHRRLLIYYKRLLTNNWRIRKIDEIKKDKVKIEKKWKNTFRKSQRTNEDHWY